MIDFLLDSNNDLNLTGATTSTVQNRVKRKLKMFYGEWEFDKSQGLLRKAFFDTLDTEYIKSVIIIDLLKDTQITSVTIEDLTISNSKLELKMYINNQEVNV